VTHFERMKERAPRVDREPGAPGEARIALARGRKRFARVAREQFEERLEPTAKSYIGAMVNATAAQKR